MQKQTNISDAFSKDKEINERTNKYKKCNDTYLAKTPHDKCHFFVFISFYEASAEATFTTLVTELVCFNCCYILDS